MVTRLESRSAQLPPGGGDDVIITTSRYAIMLDGATAFVPVPVAAAVYARQLGGCIARQLGQPQADLREVLARAIAATAAGLELRPGESPSSTVIIVRAAGADVECLVLGDSLAVLAGQVITDDRISSIRPDLRQRYRERLADGHGYDTAHRTILAELQTAQAQARNQPGGYWIAETDPAAAGHAIITRTPANQTPWAILATDGAWTTARYLGLADWPACANATTSDLAQLLDQCQAWEATDDPDGQKLPRAKRHDDKSLIAVSIGH